MINEEKLEEVLRIIEAAITEVSENTGYNHELNRLYTAIGECFEIEDRGEA